MKVSSLSIKNVKSFKDSTALLFDKKFNILVGPNGGGKSNLLDILNIVLRNFFLIT
ncbi:AAA family ATPase, partial [Leptolyngbya sp. FACHB-671]|nr:AAA family ATPase [Leptolyngbya sp. FACHB-671]